MTGPGTLPAVLPVVISALVTTGLTDVCANGANGAGMVTASRHHYRSHCAQLRAVDVHGDAPGHHLDVWLLQARGRTMVTGHCAAVAGFDTGCVFLVRHKVSRWWVDEKIVDV